MLSARCIRTASEERKCFDKIQVFRNVIPANTSEQAKLSQQSQSQIDLLSPRNWQELIYAEILKGAAVPPQLTKEPLDQNLTWLHTVPCNPSVCFKLSDGEEHLREWAAELRNAFTTYHAAVIDWEDVVQLSQPMEETLPLQWFDLAASFLHQVCEHGLINYPAYLLWAVANGKKIALVPGENYLMAYTQYDVVHENVFAMTVLQQFHRGLQASGMLMAGPVGHVTQSLKDLNMRVVESAWPGKAVNTPLRVQLFWSDWDKGLDNPAQLTMLDPNRLSRDVYTFVDFRSRAVPVVPEMLFDQDETTSWWQNLDLKFFWVLVRLPMNQTCVWPPLNLHKVVGEVSTKEDLNWFVTQHPFVENHTQPQLCSADTFYLVVGKKTWNLDTAVLHRGCKILVAEFSYNNGQKTHMCKMSDVPGYLKNVLTSKLTGRATTSPYI